MTAAAAMVAAVLTALGGWGRSRGDGGRQGHGLSSGRQRPEAQVPALAILHAILRTAGLQASGRRVASEPTLRWALSLVLIVPLLLALPQPLRAEFSGVDYTLTNQNGQDFSGQDLAHTSFAGAQGRQAVFHGADLHGAILTQAAFPDADFSAADLSDVLMDKVDFSGADFRGAVLRGVIASGSSFRGARITDADFSEALIDRDDQRALCREASGTNPITGVSTRLSLDCS